MTAKDIWGKKGICEKSRKVFNIVSWRVLHKEVFMVQVGVQIPSDNREALKIEIMKDS